MIKRFFYLAAAAVCAAVCQSCGIYSFSGTSIQPDIQSFTIEYIQYKALRVNPSLSNDLTEALMDQFRRFTRLEQVDMDGDLVISGEITGYDVKAITADEVAAQNRLTVTVKIYFTNNKYPEEDFDEGKSFSAYADFDATQLLDSVESTLCEEIIDKLVEDIFNATVANW